MGPTKSIAEFVLKTEFDAFPEEAVYLSKRLFLDCLGVALAAGSEPVIKKLTKLLKTEGGRKKARVWGKPLSLPLSNAVMINGTMAHALDYDDSAFSHPTATLLPVVVALGEELQLSGKEILAALLIGYEVFAAISLCSNQQRLRGQGWHPTPILGTMASAAAASKLLGLGEDKILMALGIAASSAGGIGQNFGTMTKPLHAGFAARNGLFAARLAGEGVTADGHILEAERGFGNAFFGRRGHRMKKINDILGPPYKVISPGVNIKPYPCCRGAHKSIDAALALRKKMGNRPINPDRIDAIECDLHLDGPTIHRYPKTGLEAKFSIAYCVSIALLRGKAGLAEFLDQNLTDSTLQKLMKKIADVRLPGEDEVITVRMKDGRILSHSIRVAKGDAQKNPMSDRELMDKFQACAKAVLPPGRLKRAGEEILKLEKVRDFRKFMDRIMGTN